MRDAWKSAMLRWQEAEQFRFGPAARVNDPDGWPSLTATEITSRRAGYARAVAKGVVQHTELLLDAWSESGSNFRRTWTTAGPGNATYASQQAALNSLNEALFYIENDVKDLKLALPSGLSPDCPAAVCPESAKAPYAKISTANLERNVIGFRRLFQGCGADFGGIGFEDSRRMDGRERPRQIAGGLTERRFRVGAR